MKEETILAFGAFIIAVASGFLNYLYTRRQFQFATSPTLAVELNARIHRVYEKPEFFYLVGAFLSPDVQNLNSSIALSEVTVSMNIGLLPKRRFFNFPKGIQFSTKYVGTVAPLEHIDSSLLRNFGDFVATQFPKIVHKYENYYSGQFRENIIEYPSQRNYSQAIASPTHGYQMVIPHTFVVSIEVSYRPSSYNAKKTDILKSYIIVPTLDQFKFLTNWEIQPLKRHWWF